MIKTERFNIALSVDTLKAVDRIAQDLNAYRVDVIEIMIAFYLAYVGIHRHERLMKTQKTEERERTRCDND